MHSFEKYLLEKGYKPYREIFNKGVGFTMVEIEGDFSYSSMGLLQACYRKEGCADIWFGLDIADTPPTLCGGISVCFNLEDGGLFIGKPEGNEPEKILNRLGYDEVLKRINGNGLVNINEIE